jgi:hypothetical protein
MRWLLAAGLLLSCKNPRPTIGPPTRSIAISSWASSGASRAATTWVGRRSVA